MTSDDVTDRTFEAFMAAVKDLLEPTATGKGYNLTGVDGQNQLFEFVHSFAGDGHAGGEICYKVKRYMAKGDETDVLKIAAWAFLIYKHRK